MFPRLLLVPLALCVGQSCLAGTALEDLAALMQGRFDSHPPGRSTNETTDERIIDSRQQLVAPDIGALVVYLQLNHGADLDLYRQRLLVVDLNPDGHLSQTAFTLSQPEKFVDAKTGDDVLLELSRDDLEQAFTEGCEQIWSRTDDGFRGYVDPGTCVIISSRTGKPRRIEAETVVTEDRLLLAERGFDMDYVQLFGTPPGQSMLLHRVIEDAAK